jgi:hypothetical protein
MHCPATFIAAGFISFWCRLMAWRLTMTVARVTQAVVENIPWRDTRLARESIAGVVCLMLAVKALAIGG